MEITKGSIGPETTYDVEIKDGALVASAQYKGADSEASLSFKHDFAKLIDKGAKVIKDLIPGTYEDAIVDGVAQTIKNAIK